MFPYRYWIVESSEDYRVVRGRCNPTYWLGEYTLVDGPLDTQEAAARALAFWIAQDDGTHKSYDETDEHDEHDDADWWKESQ